MTTANPFTAKRSQTPAASAAPAASNGPAFETAPSTKPEVNTTAPAAKSSGDPFAMPAGPGSGEKITDFMGELVLVKPVEYLTDLATSIGTADAIRVDTVVLTGERQGDLIENMLVFQTALMRDLKRIMEGSSPFLLGKLGKGQAKAGKSAPYIFEQPTEDDITLARQYLAAQG